MRRMQRAGAMAKMREEIAKEGPVTTWARQEGGGRRGMMEPMLSRYIQEAMARAQYRLLEDGTCFGEIPGLRGVWANEPKLDQCRAVLQEVLKDWLIVSP